MAVIEHDFGNGLTVKNGSCYADYNRGYQNVYPGGTGGGPGGGAVTPDQTPLFARTPINNTTNRENAFNQTDFVYKTATGPVLHTVAFGTEFGRQTGLSLRNSGIFPNNGNQAFDRGQSVQSDLFRAGRRSITIADRDANSKYRLNIASGYAQDQIELTRWLQLFVGARYDSFDLSALDQNTNIQRDRVDDNVSPRAAVIVKPIDNLSVYTAWSISYLPASGDQFSALSPGTLILQPQKFENTEVGVKWNIQPKLLFTAAAYELIRTNVPIADPSGNGLFFPSGSHKIRGFETALDRLHHAGLAVRARLRLYRRAGSPATRRRPSSPATASSSFPTTSSRGGTNTRSIPMWAAAVGVIYFSDFFASSDDTVRLPGFVRFDAAVYRKINETWRAQLNVENIFNKGYWATADGNNNISPGQPLTIRLSAMAKF